MNTHDSDASIKEQATAWLARRDRGFRPGEQADFERWCNLDPRYGQAVAAVEAAWDLFDNPRTEGTTDLLRADLRDLDVRQTRRRVVIGGSSLAAACVAALLWQQSAWLVFSTPAEVTAQVSQPKRQNLPDGSIIELKRGAEIAVDYAGAFRRVSLQKGEAHFQVAKNKDRPFIVLAGGVEVRAVGTAFSVDRGQAQVEVLVTEGRVAVERAAANSSDGSNLTTSFAPVAETIATVDAGHRIVVEVAPKAEAALPVVAVPKEELSERLAWRLPRLEFTDTTIGEAVALFNRNNSVQLRIADEELARVRVSGVFRSDNIDGFVGLLETSFGVRAVRSEKAITLQKAR